MGHRGNSIEEQLNLFKIVYKLKLSELRKKCKRLKNSENFWLSKNDEMKEKMKALVDQIDTPKSSINNILIFKSEANLRNNLITNQINNYANINNTCTETPNTNYNDICMKLTAEYNDEELKSAIVELKEELEMLHFEQEEPNQNIQILQNTYAKLQTESKQNNNFQLDEVVKTVRNHLKSKEEVQKKFDYYKKIKFLN